VIKTDSIALRTKPADIKDNRTLYQLDLNICELVLLTKSVSALFVQESNPFPRRERVNTVPRAKRPDATLNKTILK